jgi:3'-phosphoadenosine 5'-phosphosulfate (PAPS) 3'-phosphatase
MFIDAKTSKWDTCAGEAIIRAMGGFTATQNSSQIEYLADESFENSSGFIFSLFEDVLQNVTNIII